MKKVLHLLASNKYSGAENVVCQIIDNFKCNNEIEMIYCSPKGEIEKILIDKEIKFLPLENLNIKEVRNAIKRYKPTIIHAHDFTSSIIATKASRNVKIISHIHHNPLWIKKYNIKSFLYYITTFKYKKVLFVSNAIYQEYIFSKYISKKIEIVSNPIDISKLNEFNNESEKMYDLAFLGRLTDLKQPLLFIEIVHEISKMNKKVKAVIIGDGNLKDQCKQYIIQLGLEENINLVGFVSNPEEYLCKSMLLCMPSKWEGFGLAAVEALALGIPVLCSGVGGLKSIVNINCGAICTEVKDYVEEYFKMQNKEYYISKKIGAKNRARDLNNINEYILKLKNIYLTI